MSIPSIGALASKAERSALVAEAEARVVREQWASWLIWSPEPLYFERNQYSRGRKLAKQPGPKKDAKLYGYDADGAVVRIRTWSGFLGRWHEEEIFLPRRDGVEVAYRFDSAGKLTNAHRYTHDAGGRLLLHEVYFAGAKRAASQAYVWQDGLLQRVDVTDWGHGWALEWDELGRLQTIAQVHQGRRSETWRRPPDGETLPELLAIVRERLRLTIPDVVARVKPESTAYALALVIDEEEWRYLLPPSLAVGFEEDRARALAAHPDRPRDFLWSAPELPTFDVPELGLDDARLNEASTRANQHIWSAGQEAKVKPLLRGLATELQALDWGAIRRVSDDFVVYVTSAEGGGWRDVRLDAPLAVRERLIARKEL